MTIPTVKKRQNQISHIEASWNEKDQLIDVAFRFVGSDEWFSSREFIPDSHTREYLEAIEDSIWDLYNETPESQAMSSAEEEE